MTLSQAVSVGGCPASDEWSSEQQEQVASQIIAVHSCVTVVHQPLSAVRTKCQKANDWECGFQRLGQGGT